MERRRGRRDTTPPMPAGTVVAMTFLVLGILMQIWSMTQPNTTHLRETVWIGLSSVIVFFLARGHPLARQWARFWCVFVWICVSVILLTQFNLGGGMNSILMFLIGIVLLLTVPVFVGLGTEASKRYFDLYCVQCDGFRVHGRNLWFTRIRCKKCKQEWHWRKGGRIHVEAF